jgi:hypothetical protein
MQHNENMKAESSGPGFQDANQREVAALAEALGRWLDDGGTSDNKAASHVEVRAFSRSSL